MPDPVKEIKKHSEKTYQTIFENTGTATILIEEDTTIVMVNSEFEKLSGYSKGEIEGISSWQKFIAEGDIAMMTDYHYLRRKGGGSAPRNYECGLVNKNGETRRCSMTVAMIPGTMLSVASLLDITGRIKAEERLRLSEEKYRLLVETMSDGLGIQDQNGIILYVNDRICRMIGHSRDEIIGKPTIDLLVDEYRELWTEMMMRRVRTNHEPYEIAWNSSGGSVIYTIVSPKPLFDDEGKFTGSFAVFTDITLRKKAEEALRMSEEKFSKAFRSSPDSITISTLDEGRFIDVNDSFLRITGYNRDEVVDRTVIELDIWPDAEYRRRLISRLVKRGRIIDLEVSFRIKSGEMRTGIYSAELIDLQGRSCLISVFADITEQRRLEREVLNISENERRKIGQDLHDDLQQHLIGIEAMVHLLHKRLEQKIPAEAAVCGDVVKHLRESIAKTRIIARGLCPVYLNENAFTASIEDLAKTIESTVAITCSVRSNGIITISDNMTAVHLYHIIQESVNNAIRHGKAGVIDISIAPENGDITVRVTDNGAGIPDENERRDGLGLNIMKYRARIIGASLDIRRNQGGGTTVSCSLNQRL